MEVLIAFWSHALAAAAFLGLVLWRVGTPGRVQEQKLLLAGFAITACWAWISAIMPGQALAGYAETARNLIWIGLLYSLSAGSDQRQRGVRLVYFAVAAVLGMQLVVTTLRMLGDSAAAHETALLLRITAAAGALVLVHNLYGQASPASRTNIRLAMVALSLTWSYDLNLYTIAYLDPRLAPPLLEWRGLVVALSAPLFALAARKEEGWRIRLSRAATFQSLSLLAICAYFALMAILATAMRGIGWDWSRGLLIGLLAAMTVGAMVLVPSARARRWAKVKVAKHFFEHRYDYRTEWLRFTQTLGTSGDDAPPLGQRVIKAFADILEAPGGLLLAAEAPGAMGAAASWNWPGRSPDDGEVRGSPEFWAELETSGHILELDGLREGWPRSGKLNAPIPEWIVAERRAWIGIPLIHNDRLFGLLLLAGPDYRRGLDWEDFDLLKTAGRQAAGFLAQIQATEALLEARKFDAFNRMSAFVVHDLKNIITQLSLMVKNAERHRDNPEFQKDMLLTVEHSVERMRQLMLQLRAGATPVAGSFGVNLAAIIRRIQQAKATQAPALSLSLQDGIMARGHEERVERVIGHVIQNALDATPTDGRIDVLLNVHDGMARVEVTDTGKGMPPEFVRDRLFKPFQTTKEAGMGIGAYESFLYVQELGGRIEVDSEENVGTRVAMIFPLFEVRNESDVQRLEMA